MPSRSDIIHGLRAFICTELIQDAAYPLQENEPLMSSGLIDSFSIAHIAVFIEQAFGVYIPDPELTVENMDTLSLIATRVLQG